MKTATLALASLLVLAPAVHGATFTFTTGTPDGRMASASRPSGVATIEIESADDFIVSGCTTSITSASFFGLLPSGAPLSSITSVDVEIYRIYPMDSNTSRTPNVPTRTNSPSDVAFDSRGSTGGTLSFSAAVIAPAFTAANSVLNGINPSPGQTTGGEGPVTGEEVEFQVTFTTPLVLPAGHYFFVPQVGLSSGDFFWLSAPRPLFTGDLQSWIRNASLDPDWLRIGTDIVGGTAAFNAAFSLAGTTVPVVVTASSPSPLNGVEGTALSAVTFSATGGTGPYTFTTASALPAGVTLAANGTLSGTPADEGTFPITVTATDSGGCTGTLSYTIAVADAPLTATGVSFTFTPGTSFTGTVATFHDANTAAPASDFTATITWGDGSTSSGTIVSTGGGNFSVTGTHTFATTGPFTVSVAIHDVGGSSATATAQAVNALAVPALGPWMLALLAIAIAVVAARALGA